MQILTYEIGGIILVLIALAMLWIARPVQGKPALFLRRGEWIEIAYTLAVLFVLCGGLGGILLGATT